MSGPRTIDLLAIALVSGAGLLLLGGATPGPAGLVNDLGKGTARTGDDHTDGARLAPGAIGEPYPGQDARSPAEIPARGWWAVIKRVVTQFNDHRLMYEAGSVVFFVLLALFPALAALVSLYGLFADPKTVADHLAMLSTVMPAGSMDILNNQLTNLASNTGSKLSFGVVFGFAVSLWSSNQGMKSLFDVLNVAYDEQEKRSYIRLTLITLGFTLASLVFTLIAIAAVVVLPAALQFVYLGAETDLLVRTLRWPVLLVIITLLLSVIYRYGPSSQACALAMGDLGRCFRSHRLVARVVCLFVLRQQVRLLQQDLWLARRSDRLHDLDLDIGHGGPHWR